MAAAITDRTKVGAGLHAQQPDRPGGHPGRAGRLPRHGPVARAGRRRRGLPGVRPDGRRRSTASRPTAATTTSCSPAPSPRPTGWPASGSGTPSRRPRSRPRCARSRCRSASRRSPRPRRSPRSSAAPSCSSGSTRWWPSGTGSSPGCAAAGLGRPGASGQLRLVRAGRADRRVRRRRRRGRHRRTPVRRGGRAGLDRRARGQRPARRGGVGLRLTRAAAGSLRRVSSILTAVSAALLSVALGVSSPPAAEQAPHPRPLLKKPGAERALDAMSLAQRVGQLFMVGTPADEVDRDDQAQIGRFHVGNVMLTGRSYARHPAPARVSRTMRAQVSGRRPTASGCSWPPTRRVAWSGCCRARASLTMPDRAGAGTWRPARLRAAARRWGRELRRPGSTSTWRRCWTPSRARGRAKHNPPIGATTGSSATPRQR